MTSDDKTEAFRRAARHSRHVRWLRWVVLFGAVMLALGVTVFAFFNPFQAIVPRGVSIESAGLDGTRVTMAHPKMSGYRKDGRPYDFNADSAVQDLKVPSVLQLNTLDAHITMNDGIAHVRADVGVYDTSKETMDLKGGIRITSDAGFDIRMSSAHIDFKGNTVTSSDPVDVAMKTATVKSDSMHMTGNGADVTFEGHVRSVMAPPLSGQPGKPTKGNKP